MLVVDHRKRPVILSQSGEPSLSMVVNSDVGASSLSVWVTNHQAGEVVPRHVHTVEEILTVVEGEGIVTVGGESAPIGKDMSVVIPAGTPHGYRNTGTGLLRLVITLADSHAKLGKPVE